MRSLVLSLALLLDFGSTFTKMTVVDTADATLVTRATVPTTTNDINIGLRAGLARLADWACANGICDFAWRAAVPRAAWNNRDRARP